MLTAIVLSAVFAFPAHREAADSVATPAPGPAASAPAQKPLREVVFDVTTNWRNDDITESYAGGADATNPGSTEVQQGQGTVTIDVFGQTPEGGLIVSATEVWKQPTKQLPYTGTVEPSGVLDFDSIGPTALDDVCGELLPYFGTRFAPLGTLDSTTHWSLQSASGKITATTDYNITAVAGDTVTVHKSQTIKSMATVTVDGSVVYEPSKLVALSGTVRKRSTELYADGQTTNTLIITFTRVSDTFAQKS